MKQRLLVSVLILLAIFFLPYWLYLPLLFLGMVFIPFYWEAILLAFLIDVLYGPGTSLFFSRTALYTAILLMVMMPVRERLRWRL
jgi:hypothetical protein